MPKRRLLNFFAAGLVVAAVGPATLAYGQLLRPIPNPPGPPTSIPAPPTLLDSKGKFAGYVSPILPIVFNDPYTVVAIDIKGVWALAAVDVSRQNIVSPPSAPAIYWSGPNCTGTPYLNGQFWSLIPVATIGIPAGQTETLIYYGDPAGALKSNLAFASSSIPPNPTQPIPRSLPCDNTPGTIPSAFPALSIKASSLGWTPPFKVKPPQ